MKGAVSSLGPGPPPRPKLPLSQSHTMAVAEGARAPTESLLFTDQCVYLSRKHLLWSRKGFGEAGGQPFPDQRHAEEKALELGTGQAFCWSWISTGH